MNSKTQNDRLNQHDLSGYEKALKLNKRSDPQNLANMHDPLYVIWDDGQEYKITPSIIAARGLYFLNQLLTESDTSWLSVYLKQIIWTFQNTTACTDGIRIMFNPVYASTLLAKGNLLKVALNNQHMKEYNEEMKDEDKNAAYGKFFKFVLVHECYHQVYLHLRRGMIKYGTKVNVKDIKRCNQIANIAMDMEINRDIESQYAKFDGATLAIHGIWYHDSIWMNKDTNKYFEREAWDEIYDYLCKHPEKVDDLIDKNEKKLQGASAGQQRNNSNIKGWNDAVKNIKSKNFDPFKI